MIHLRNIAIFLLVSLLFVSFLTPQIAAYFINSLYIYTNGWDEPTYMAYQEALSSRAAPGYFLLAVVAFLHELGLSGSIQNLLFDIFVPLGIFILVTKIFMRMKESIPDSMAYAGLIVFGQMIFNQSTSYGKYLATFSNSFFVVAEQNTPQVLRTPNPQLSYLLVALAIYFFLKYKNRLILLLPIPFLYLFVVVPYCLALFPVFFIKDLEKEKLKRVTLLSMLGFLLVTLGIYVAFSIFVPKNLSDSLLSSIIKFTHVPTITFATVAMGLVALLSLAIPSPSWIKKLLLVLFISAVGTMNMQVLNGVKMLPWGFDGHGVGVLAAISLALLLFSLGKVMPLFIKGLLQISILYFLVFLNFKASDFNFETWQWRIYKGADISQENIEKIKKYPLSAIIAHNDIASNIGYAFPKIPLMLFSYQYDFANITQTCSSIPQLHDQAYEFVMKNVPKDNFAYEQFVNRYNKFLATNKRTPAQPEKENSPCYKYLQEAVPFFLVPTQNQTWVYFP